MRLLIAGGGTGGHIYPALAVARSLRARAGAPELGWLGGHRGLERDIVPAAGIPLRRLLLRSLRSAGRDVHLVLDPSGSGCRSRRRRCCCSPGGPAAIFTTGGYVAIPTLLAAARPAHPERALGGQRGPRPERPRSSRGCATVVAVSHRGDRRGPRRAAHLRDRHADPLARGRGPGRGSRALRRPARGADPARLRRVAGRAPDQRRRHGGAAAARRAGARRPRHRRRRLRGALAAREALPEALRDRYRPFPFLHERHDRRARRRRPRASVAPGRRRWPRPPPSRCRPRSSRTRTRPATSGSTPRRSPPPVPRS